MSYFGSRSDNQRLESQTYRKNCFEIFKEIKKQSLRLSRYRQQNQQYLTTSQEVEKVNTYQNIQDLISKLEKEVQNENFEQAENIYFQIDKKFSEMQQDLDFITNDIGYQYDEDEDENFIANSCKRILKLTDLKKKLENCQKLNPLHGQKLELFEGLTKFKIQFLPFKDVLLKIQQKKQSIESEIQILRKKKKLSKKQNKQMNQLKADLKLIQKLRLTFLQFYTEQDISDSQSINSSINSSIQQFIVDKIAQQNEKNDEFEKELNNETK